MQLEPVPTCPVCGASERIALHTLRDPRRLDETHDWTLVRCRGCGVAILDPRPTPETLHEAYAAYYTHVETAVEPPPAGVAGKARRALRNGHVNRRFGLDLSPALPGPLAAMAMALAPALRSDVERSFRHLPAGDRLLDIGCGNGTFVSLATQSGWQAVGIDVDADATAIGRQAGLDLRTIDVAAHLADVGPGRYDAVTMHHVIEHVADPVAVLRCARELLRPGGLLWIATPNLAGLGHRRYGAAWTSLDPPRHLLLFDHRSLTEALGRAGFGPPWDAPYTHDADEHFVHSESIARGELPGVCKPASIAPRVRLLAQIADAAAVRDRTRGEEIVLFARAPRRA